MKIIEGLKRLKVLEKRITDTASKVSQYAAVWSNQKPAFATEEEQRKEVIGLLQSAEDLQLEYLKLKRDIDYTNAMAYIEMGGKKLSLNELLTIKRKTAVLMQVVYKSLNTDNLVRGRSPMAAQGESVKPVQLYDERMKNEKLAYWQDLYDNIESRLEVINATGELLEAPRVEAPTSVATKPTETPQQG